MPYGLVQTVAPANLVVELDEMKRHLRYGYSIDDDYIEGLTTAATVWMERQKNVQMVNATWRLTLDSFPSTKLVLPVWPLASVSSVQYIDADGDTQTLDTSKYKVSTDRRPGLMMPAYGECWPTTREELDAVKVTFVAGFGSTGASVPEDYRAAVRMLVHHWFVFRTAVKSGETVTEVPLGVQRILDTIEDGVYAHSYCE